MQLTETLSAYELERGKPMPSKNHATVQMRLGSVLIKKFDDQFSILSELTLTLSGKEYVPDLCIYPKMKPDWLNDEPSLTAAPLTIIEIVSPSQGYDVFENKLKVYFSNGVKSFWLVNPFLQSIALFSPNGHKPTVFSTGELVDSATDVRITIEEIFV